jgi:hypothetical protein
MADINLTTTAVMATAVTIATLRSRLRRELHDEDAQSYRWTDAELDRHLTRAARALSLVWPRDQRTALATTAGSRAVALTALTDLVEIEAVEYPTGEWPPSYVRFSVFETTLTLLVESEPSAVQPIEVYWGKLHTLDANSSSLPTIAEDAVVTGAAAYAALEWASFATNRANVGGPDAWRDYQAWGEERLRAFQAALSEFGRGREGRLRTAGLYRPERAAGRSTAQFDA